ncbi:peptidyl-prolyl isomerase CWC27 [Pochonia chlamydosporia 170]|uniref:peptidylprolyl isomerase n=1 Tax=Pochonia chlamydosporia 170 TaxID=1380566 RepID=A0A179F7A0_METCM|nr:peptidyl-prolyl isomerase CWC27 [Pochonia chlamydosporia 170]OAQ61033.1 peptidyl-prolyl isomerase CWC27 [Pochonia chlamydosporia 170]
MSAIYNLEPQPTASAIIHTTLGEILVELFAKQTPLTCRNFLQHSLDGYYDGTIFHRLVPNFILQGGDPTGTGNGGESIYDGGAFSGDLDPWPMDERRGINAGPTGINFKDEFHSRLKFNRRGLLGMANESRTDTNGSQFFFTLDKTEELNGKNTLFGRVAGDTIYNLAKIGESEVDEASERPLYAVKIERIEILVNPFEDMKKRSRVATHAVQKSTQADKSKKKKRKGGKQLLSFGDEEGEEEEEPVFKKAKFDTRLIAQEEEQENEPNRDKVAKKKSSKAEQKKQPVLQEPSAEEKTPSDDEQNTKQARESRGKARQQSEDLPEEPQAPKKTALEKANEELAALKASMRRTIHSEQPTEETKKKSALESLIPESSMRARKRRPGGNNASTSDDQAAMNLLRAFQSRLDKAPPEKEVPESTKQGGEDKEESAAADEEAELCDLHFIANCQSCTAWDKQDKEESDDEGWMSHSLSFAADRLGKDLSNRKKAEEELVVIDPREKARTLKEDKRAEREAKLGGGSRAWDQARDQARNAKLARASSLAGRGAK